MTSTRLSRRLGVFDAVVIGLGSMIGAGIFAAVGPAAAVAGSGLLIGLTLAGAVAYANATSSAQLAAVYPEAGGTYVYAGRRLGDLWGFLAGWAFVVGKLASCAAMALTFGAYAAPSFSRPLAVGAVVGVTAVNYRGVRKTAGLTRVIVALVLAALAAAVAASLLGGQVDAARLGEPFRRGGFVGTLRAAGFLFFAFAGYARIATLGEEVVEPERTIPKAIPRALGITLVVYVIVSASALVATGPQSLGASDIPLVAAVRAGRFDALVPVVRAGAAIAALGVLLSLLAGISRTAFAMGSKRDLPAWLAAVHPRFRVPHHAELAAAAVIIAAVLVSDLRSSIGFSSFAVLLYYALTNVSAYTLPPQERLWPRWLTVAGAAGCLLLSFSLPLGSILSGAVLILAGALIHLIRR